MGYGTDVGGLDNIKVTASLVDNVTKPLRSMLYQTKKMTKGFGNMTKNQIKTNNAMVKMRKESMLFKKGMTSMMSSLFFFKALKQSMDGLLAPAFETVGIFDLFSTMLQVVFLPIALWVLQNVMLPIFNFFTGLPEPVKFAVGAIVSFVSAVSGIMVLVKAIQIFTVSTGIIASLGTAFTTVGTIIGGAIALITSPIGLIVLAVAALLLAWKYNFGGIQDNLQTVYDGIKSIVDGIIKILSGDLSGGIKDIATGIGKIFDGLAALVFDTVNDMVVGIFDLLGKIPLIGDKFLALKDKLGLKSSLVTKAQYSSPIGPIKAPNDVMTGQSYAQSIAPIQSNTNNAVNNYVTVYSQKVDETSIMKIVNDSTRTAIQKYQALGGKGVYGG